MINVKSKTFSYIILSNLIISPFNSSYFELDLTSLTDADVKSLEKLYLMGSLDMSDEDYSTLINHKNNTIGGGSNNGSVGGGSDSSITEEYLSNLLSKYVTSTSLTNTLKDKVSKTELNSYALTSSLSDVVRKTELSTYATKTNLTDGLKDKALKSELTNLVNKTTLDSTVATLSTKTELNNYALKTALVDLVHKDDLIGLVESPETLLDNYITKDELSDYALKTELVDYKLYSTSVLADSDGKWSIDLTPYGFTEVPIVTATGQSVGTALADKRFASIDLGKPTLTSCSGVLLSSSSAGLLAAMTMVSGSGVVNLVIIGK